ncbi:MAG: CusA/CzcA family heavy metal efflux RND transporter [Planctomycetes bacterium]|nr:CusA/CzcA family heavy metal efflux RND transporter [Planctomycetota bacterium]MBI3833432.1 CusA/CzcA family heavy metal efflux RND transporter [Planctomycetota bacterium]
MLEELLHFSIRNRWVMVLFAILLGAMGFLSLKRLPIDAVPDITNNQVQINTMFPALSPAEIEKQITFPVETALAGIPGLQYTRSFSRNGFSQVTAVFDDDVNIYFARNQINERLASSRQSLPPGASPLMGPISTGLGEIYMYMVDFEHPHGTDAPVVDGKPGWQSDGSYLTPEGDRFRSDLELAAYLRTIQDWVIRPQLRNVKDVAGVDSNGGYEKQYHVQPDPMKLVSYGLTFTDVIEALEKNNVATGAGFIEHKGEAYTVRAAARLQNVEQIAGIPVGTRSGVPICIRDVATVGIGRQLRTGSATENGHEGVLGMALMLMRANSRTVADAVDAKLVEIRRSLPPDIRARTVLNRKKLVDATIETVTKNLGEGAALVIVILFLLLGNLRAALITAIAIPMSMLMTAIGMVQAKISGNLMSLGAIDFGLIVDGAVIIVENCLRRLAHRQHELDRTLSLQERLHEVMTAAKEMIQPSVYGQAIIVTVYLPILALTGVEGKMFHPMAMTVIFALVSAFILSLTLVPALVAILIRGRVKEQDVFLIRWAKMLYEPILRWAVRLRWVVVGSAVLGFAGSLALFATLGSEFAPNLDEQDVVVMATRPISTGIEQSTQMQLELEQAIEEFPQVQFVWGRTGTAEMATDPMTPNLTDTFIMLKPRPEWPDPSLPKETLIAQIEKRISTVPGNAYEFTQPIQMRFNELVAGVRSDIAVKVYGDDFERMRDTAQQIARVLSGIFGAADIKVEQTEGMPLVNVTADREKAARLGIDMAHVQDAVAVAIGGREAGLVFEGDRRVDIVVRLPEQLRADIETLEKLPVPLPREDASAPAMELTSFASNRRRSGGNNGAASATTIGFVPLGAIASIEVSEGPNQISRYNGKRMITVQANVRGRDLGSFVAEAERAVSNITLPPGGWLEWGGQYENLVAARERLMVVVPICFFLIFLLLFSTFKSIKYALMVFSGVPLGLSGGILALWLRSLPFSISAGVGFIALSGVAVLNGLVMVSFINQLRREGLSRDEAMIRGSLTRLRPVLMTALVASLGFIPMAIARGTGAEVQRPLATVVIGGLITSTLLTLLVLPALYRIFTASDRIAHSVENELGA